ncbi:hypothetical protein EYF80_051044 [Liparis tanakae]|uniref:Uncharacterized protein n=1 Tax=Liparis tanakae TaxID=230148 RepID=A0A4Z2FC79_9TELE|nr:hypothetical protein EYF80_051044 [Liparis tanakae]
MSFALNFKPPSQLLQSAGFSFSVSSSSASASAASSPAESSDRLRGVWMKLQRERPERSTDYEPDAEQVSYPRAVTVKTGGGATGEPPRQTR